MRTDRHAHRSISNPSPGAKIVPQCRECLCSEMRSSLPWQQDSDARANGLRRATKDVARFNSKFTVKLVVYSVNSVSAVRAKSNSAEHAI